MRGRRGVVASALATILALWLVFAVAAGLARASDPPAAGAARLTWSPALPPTWQELPWIAENAASAANRAGGKDLTVDSRAWGDPGLGCFLVALDIDMAVEAPLLGPSDVARAVAAAGFQVDRSKSRPATPVVPAPASQADGGAAGPAPSMRASLAFADAGVHGELRAVVSLPGRERVHARAVACFYSEREPAWCARSCQTLLPAFEDLE